MPSEMTERIIASGIAPLELEFHKIKDIQNDDFLGFRTLLKINSQELGALYPEQYRIVSNRTVQCSKLALWGYKTLLAKSQALTKKYSEDFFVSLYIPVRMLKKNELFDLLNNIPDEDKGFLKHLALEFSSDLLLEESVETAKSLASLKEQFGVKLILDEFGDEFCPVMRISKLPFDYVILDKSITNVKILSSAATKSLLQMISDLSMQGIVCSSSKDVIASAAESGCETYCENRSTVVAGERNA